MLYEGAGKFPLIAIPLFVLAGALMNATSISRRLIGFCLSLVGFFRGGLAMVSIVASMIFAEISGSSVADVAALGLHLDSRHEGARLSEGAGGRGDVVGGLAGDHHSAVDPNDPLRGAGRYVGGQAVCRRHNSGLLRRRHADGDRLWFARRYNLPRENSFSLRHRRGILGRQTRACLPVIILGGIFGGIVTATEGGALAVVAALAIGLYYRELNAAMLRQALFEGVTHTAVVMLLVATSALLGVYLTETQIPQRLAESVTNLTHNPLVVLAILNLVLFVLGFFLHGAAAIILVVPVVLPLIKAVGIDPIHFGIIVTLNIAVGQQTPPVASVLMVSCSIAKANIWETSKLNVYFIATLILVLLLVTYIPFVSLGLVDLLYGP